MTSTTSSTEQSRAILEQFYAAAPARDVEGLLAPLADDVVVYEPWYLPYGGVYRGKQEFVGLFGKIDENLDVSGFTVNYLVADGDRVATYLSVPDATTGEFTEMIELATVRDGKISELKLFYYDPQAMIEKGRAASGLGWPGRESDQG
jgi:hypothetical protein